VRSPVVIATDLTEDSNAALVRGRGVAEAMGTPLVVCHVIPDVLRHHPLAPTRDENDLLLGADLTKRAADLVTDHVGRVLKMSADDYRVVVETGTPEDEIVRVAEAEAASLIALGGKKREGAQRYLGHIAERVVRYAHTSVLVARSGSLTGKILVPTDFGEGSIPALELAGKIIRSGRVKAHLLHVMQPASSGIAAMLTPLGSPWGPPAKAAIEALEAFGKSALASLADEYGFAGYEQIEGDPGDAIIERANTLDVETIIMGSRGRTGLRRLVLGSVAEKVIRGSHCSVLVARAALLAAK
jgi:nucleotide-binding universal stress UspA family protein